MLPHQQRVVDEKTELDGRLEKLTAFFGSHTFSTLSDTEAKRLVKQAEIMRYYSTVLTERIAAF